MFVSNWLFSLFLRHSEKLSRRVRRKLVSRTGGRRQVRWRRLLFSIFALPFLIVPAKADDPIFLSDLRLSTGERPMEIRSFDFNRDGIADLVTSDEDAEQVSIFLGNGDSSFQPRQPVQFSGTVESATSADFNGDNIPDLAVAYTVNDEARVGVLLGQGDGSFGMERTLEVSQFPARTITTGDFNGDGFIDLSLSTFGYDQYYNDFGDLKVVLGSGDGNFDQQILVNNEFGILEHVSEDVNGDGLTDICAIKDGVDRLDVHLATKQLDFVLSESIQINGFANSIVCEDLDGDMVHDVAVLQTSPDSILISTGNGDGTFCLGSEVFGVGGSEMAAGDFNADGIVDLATSQTSILGSESGDYLVVQNFDVAGRDVATLDFDQDGIDDLAISNLFSDEVILLNGAGDGSFMGPDAGLAVGNCPEAIISADFDNDGNADLATVNEYSGDVSVLYGFGDGTFMPAQSFTTEAGQRFMVAADFNSDGFIDLATNGTAISILLGSSSGFSTPLLITGAGVQFNPIAAADITNDGIPDLVFASSFFDTVNLFPGDGDGTFGPSQSFPSPGNPCCIVSGDFDSDSVLDIALANSVSDDISVYASDGAGGFQNPISSGAISSSLALAVGDINSDSHLDLVSVNAVFSNTIGLYVLTGNGAGEFNDVLEIVRPDGKNPSDVLIRDFNLDSHPDLISTNAFGSLNLYLGTGDGAFDEPCEITVGSFGDKLAANDFNNDGFVDVAFTDGNSVRILLNQLGGQFLIGDVNLDGQIDLLDVSPFVELLVSGEFQLEADINQDGDVDLLDVGPFVQLIGG